MNQRKATYTGRQKHTQNREGEARGRAKCTTAERKKRKQGPRRTQRLAAGKRRREKRREEQKTKPKYPPTRQASPATDPGQVNKTEKTKKRETDATDKTTAGKVKSTARKQLSRV